MICTLSLGVKEILSETVTSQYQWTLCVTNVWPITTDLKQTLYFKHLFLWIQCQPGNSLSQLVWKIFLHLIFLSSNFGFELWTLFSSHVGTLEERMVTRRNNVNLNSKEECYKHLFAHKIRAHCQRYSGLAFMVSLGELGLKVTK